MTAAPLRVDYWADYICPWCYLALDRVEHLVTAHGATVHWHPYELHPEIPAEGAPHPPARRSRDTTEYLKEELRAAGLEVRPRPTWSNSARALALSSWAQDRPQWPELHRALYAAYWYEGADLADPAVLVGIAAEAGIDPDQATAAIDAGLGRDRAARAKERAIDLGVAATPGWLFNDTVVLSGAHPRTVFDRVVARLG